MIIHPFIVKKKKLYIGWKLDLKVFIVNTLTKLYMLKGRNDEPDIIF